MSAPTNPDFDHLLAHAGWARALARNLVRDAHSADDLVQRAWLAAIEHPPEGSTPVRRWLAAVMRNFARQDARAEERRAQRERFGARGESSPHDALDDEADLQQRLLDAVRALDEPLRSTMWARYYEGLPPRSIAARDGVPVKTVKTRLSRGLAELRARFDREHGGDRRAWIAALLPLAKSPSFSATTLGAILVSTELKIACALVAVAGTIAVWRFSAQPKTIEPALAANAPRADVALEKSAPPRLELPEKASESPRAPIGMHTKSPPTPAVKTSSVHRLHGRVLDLERHPVGGLAIVIHGVAAPKSAEPIDRETGVTSAADGRFEIELPVGTSEVGARSDAWVDVFSALAWSEPVMPDVTVLVAPRRPLAGLVVDGQHRGIARAEVGIVIDDSVRRDLGLVLDANSTRTWRTTSDASGRFEIDDAPRAPSVVLATAIGWKSCGVTPPDAPTYDLEIVLERVEKQHALVNGRVLDTEHRPVEGAYVALGPETRVSRADGGYEFDLDAIEGLDSCMVDAEGIASRDWDPRTITAAKPGFLPARASIPSAEDLRAATSATHIDLVLGGKTLQIRGKVVESDGRAVPGALIMLQGETRFGNISQNANSTSVRWRTTVERVLRGGFERTSLAGCDDGSFVVPGLQDKTYGIVAIDRRTLRRGVASDVAAGSTGVVVVLPPENACVRVAGRVVSPSGDPIAGVSVFPGRDTSADSSDDIRKSGAPIVTDERGRFEFPALDPTGLNIQVSSQSMFVVVGWTKKPSEAWDDLTIVTSRRCHAQIDLGGRTSLADRAVFVDAAGKPVKLMMSRGNASWFPTEIAIVDGRSEPIACEETARTVVLYSGEREVARVPFTPKPNDLVVVRP
jgi:RNA polymerase sigma-70 factor (ECF subfamily)